MGTSGPFAEKMIEKLQNNIKLSDVRDIKIDGASAQAKVNLEVVPLKMNRAITLNFDMTDCAAA